MTFARVKPLGWALMEELTSAQMNALDVDHADSLDGANGGAYSPSADIEFAGANSIEWMALPDRWPKLEARSCDRRQKMIPVGAVSVFGGTDDFAPDTDGTLYQAYADATGVNDPYAIFDLTNLVDLATLIAVYVRVEGSAGHAALPTEMPIISLDKYLAADGTATNLGSQTDLMGSTALYQAPHNIQITGLADVVAEGAGGSRYRLTFTGESGANAQAGLKVYDIRLEFSATLVTPGG